MANAVICSVSKNTIDLAVATANTMRYADERSEMGEGADSVSLAVAGFMGLGTVETTGGGEAVEVTRIGSGEPDDEEDNEDSEVVSALSGEPPADSIVVTVGTMEAAETAGAAPVAAEGSGWRRRKSNGEKRTINVGCLKPAQWHRGLRKFVGM